MDNLPKIIAIVGTTASGKTDLAIELAKQFNGEIISVDSRQIYKKMDIGTAKEPGEMKAQDVETTKQNWFSQIEADLVRMQAPVSLFSVLSEVYMVEDIPHYMIDVVYPYELLTLAHFQALANGIISDIISREKLPILVGGTSLYTSAILENWKIPEVQPDQNLRTELEKLSDTELVKYLDSVDKKATENIDLKNRRRIIRAIEIATQGKINKSLNKLEAIYEPLYLAPSADREVIYDRINKRVGKMVEAGLVEEVKMVADKYGYDTVAMTGHAYQQIAKYLQGEWSLDRALEETQKVTRNYAKRQLTWWRKHGDVKWVKDSGEAVSLVSDFLGT